MKTGITEQEESFIENLSQEMPSGYLRAPGVDVGTPVICEHLNTEQRVQGYVKRDGKIVTQDRRFHNSEWEIVMIRQTER